MTHLNITALDSDGNAVEDYTTKDSWCLSEIQIRFDALKIKLYNGEIDNIIFSRSENENHK